MGRRTCWIMLVGIVCACLFLCACQETPQEQAITEKDDENLRELLRNSAPPEHTPEPSGDTAQQDTEEVAGEYPAWNLTKEFDSGATLIIEAPLETMEHTSAPVAAVYEKPFSEEQCKAMVQALYPDTKICNYEITKGVIESDLLFYKEMLYKAQHTPEFFFDEDGDEIMGFCIPDSFMPLSDEEWAVMTTEKAIELNIEDLEKQYTRAPEDSELEETDYRFSQLEDSTQMNLMVLQDKKVAHLDFVNWESGIRGSEFRLSVKDPSEGEDTVTHQCVAPGLLEQDKAFVENRQTAETMLQDFDLDSMELHWVTTGESALGKTYHQLCYTRTVNGTPETYTPDYLGTTAIDIENGSFQELWRNESIEIKVEEGKIIDILWMNPADVEVENRNVVVIPWEEARQIFLKQMDRLMSPNVSEDDMQIGILGGNKEIHINRIELGLTKILMADSNEYKLVPTWTFSGYDKDRLYPADPEAAGAVTCFVTINAVDGSIIDRGLMY